MSNGNDSGPAFDPAANLPAGPTFVWSITYSPQGIRIDGPADPRLILEALGKAIVIMSAHVQPKEQPKIVPANSSVLSMLKGRSS